MICRFTVYYCEMSDAVLRQLKLLEFLPRQPRKISPNQIRDLLLDSGFDVSIRTIQRDLKNLSSILPLICIDFLVTDLWSNLLFFLFAG